MLLKIAWRNIWRSPVRSAVVIGAVLIGVWSVICLMSFSYGLITGFINKSIKHQISHIQIHHPKFQEEKEIQYTLPQVDSIFSILKKVPQIQSFTDRTIVAGMLSTSIGARGAMIKGVDTENEPLTTSLHEKIIEGNYFNGKKKNQILIGKSL